MKKGKIKMKLLDVCKNLPYILYMGQNYKGSGFTLSGLLLPPL